MNVTERVRRLNEHGYQLRRGWWCRQVIPGFRTYYRWDFLADLPDDVFRDMFPSKEEDQT